MACEEVEQARVVLAAMLVGVEPVPFAGDVQGFHRFAGVAQRTLHLLAVRNRRSAVLATGHEQHRRLDLRGQQHRRTCIQRVALTHPVVRPVAQPACRAGIVAMLRLQVVDADVTDRAAIQVRLARRAHQRGVTAIAGAIDADARWVGDALFDRPARGIGEIVLHARAPFPRTGPTETGAIVARATEVDTQHGIARLGQHLRVFVERQFVEDPVRTAVRHHHHRHRTRCGRTARRREVAMQHQAVARLHCHRAHGRQLRRIEPLAPDEDAAGGHRPGVEQVGVARRAVVPDLYQRQPAIAGIGRDGDRRVRKRPRQRTIDARGLGGLIEEPGLHFFVHVLHADQRAPIAVEDRAVGIDHGIALHLPALAGPRVPGDHGIRAVLLHHLQIGSDAVLGEAQRRLVMPALRLVVDESPLGVVAVAVIELVEIVVAPTFRETRMTSDIREEVRPAHRCGRHQRAVTRIHVELLHPRHRVEAQVPRGDQHVARIVRQGVDERGHFDGPATAIDFDQAGHGFRSHQRLDAAAIDAECEQHPGGIRLVAAAETLGRRQHDTIVLGPPEIVHDRVLNP